MARLSSIKCLNDINSQKVHELLVFGLFENSKINFTSTCSKDLSESINNTIALDDFNGKEGKMLNYYGDSSIKRILVVGIGDKKKCRDLLRAKYGSAIQAGRKEDRVSLHCGF